VSRPPDPTLPTGAERDAPSENAAQSAGTQVRAFVIADIRGYTSFTQERGDEEAGRLAARFASLCRRVVESHNGRVLELRGDEALSVFESPRSAIRAAVALQQRFVEETRDNPSLPLTVGIGIDAGEAVEVEDGYRGSALNVAARLCSLARAGEVLASRELVHLAKRIDGITFTERPDAVVKGLDRPLQVVEISADALDSVAAVAPFVRARPRAPRSRRWWPAVAITAVLAIVVSLVAIGTLTQDAGAGSEIAPNSVGVLDAESGDVTSTLGFDARPGAVAASRDAVWVAHPDVGTVTRIDSATREAVDTIPVGEDPSAIAVDMGAVWVVESGGPSVSRISPDTDTVVDTIDVGNGPSSIAVGGGSVWVTNRFDGTLLRIDPEKRAVVETIPVGLGPRGVVVGFDSVWVSLSGSNTVVRIDPSTNTVVQSIGVGSAPGSMAVTSDAVWVVNVLDDTVSSIRPDGRVSSVVEVGDSPSGITVSRGTVWVTNEGDGTISKIDPSGASASRLRIGSIPQGLATVAGDLWVAVRGTATSHRGGTLRVVSREGPRTLDTNIAYDVYSWRVLHVIGDGLVGLELVGGADGASLVPDLSTVLPRPTDDGRTYTFDVRPGIRYSNGDVVVPSDFRRALERGFRLYGDVYGSFFGGLEGGKACRRAPARCDLSGGIVADDASGTVTFHLIEPDAEFLYKLTMPFAYPVPSSIPVEEQRRTGIPGTGPYMVEDAMTRSGLILIRNPNFRQWSATAQPDGYADRIEWTFGVDPTSQVEAVQAGDSDLAYDASFYRGLDELLVRFPAQIYTTPKAATDFLVLNAETPPFDDLSVRRALNLAVDRGRIIRIFGGEQAAVTTCQHLPPNFPGYEPYCPYTVDPGREGIWTAPDLATAQRLVRRSETSGMQVTIEYPPYYWGAQGHEVGDYLFDLLEDLGYRARVETESPGAFYAPGNRFQIALDEWASDYPAASNFFINRFTCGSTLTPNSGLCDPEFDRMVDRALRVQQADPSAAGALWASIDRTVVDQALYVWLENPVVVDFVSARVGNYQYSSTWEVLLSQLWVR